MWPGLSDQQERLPPIYQNWIGDILGGAIPREGRATCSTCAMCPGNSASELEPPVRYFDPSVKCCTYLPRIPNFGVGGVIRGASPGVAAQGRQSVIDRIQGAAGVSPLGLLGSAVFSIIYSRTEPSAFGRSPALRCPHYVEEQGGMCGIWEHRNAVCATWFCRHGRGPIGAAFWRSLSHLLSEVETELALWSALKIGVSRLLLREIVELSRTTPERLLSVELAGEDHAKRYSALWGGWEGKELEFYIECANLVGALTWLEVVEVCGPRVTAGVEHVRAAFALLHDDEVPAIVTFAGTSAQPVSPQVTRSTFSSAHDPLYMPTTVWQSLSSFDGRPVDEVLRGLRDSSRSALMEPGMLRRLMDYGLLRDEVGMQEQ